MFDGLAWQLDSDAHCTSLLAHAGVVDRIQVGVRCTLNATSLDQPVFFLRGNFVLTPNGPASNRPVTPAPEPVVSVKASLINETLEGVDANPTNDVAAFPVILE
jgi:hypothetical protein